MPPTPDSLVTDKSRSLLQRHRLLFAVLFIAALVIVAGYIPVPLDRFSKRITAQVTELTGGDTLRLGGVTLQLWQGITLKEVQYATRAGKPQAIAAHINRILLDYRLLPLLWGKADIYKMTISGVAAEVTLPPETPAALPVGKAALPALPLPMGKIPVDLPVNLEIRKLRVEKTNVKIRLSPDAEVEAHGINIELSASLDKTVAAEGRLRVDSLWPQKPWLLTGLGADFALSPGRLKVSDCAFSLYDGKVRMDLAVDTTADMLLNASFSLKHLDLADLMKAAHFDKGKVSGKVNLQMQVQSRNADPRLWSGQGKFEADKMVIADLPFQNTLAALLFLPKLKHLEFKQVTTSLNLSHGKITTPDLRGEGNLMNLSGAGWVGLNLQASEKVTVSLSSEMCSHLPPVISREMLLPAPEGRCEIKGELHGPLSELQFEVDKSIKTRTAGAILKRAGGLLQNWLRKR